MSGKHKGMSETSAPLVPLSNPVQSVQERPNQVELSAEASSQDHAFEAALRAALHANKIADARTLVANAEAVLFAHSATESSPEEQATQAQLAAAKARIAIATGDGSAARAILVKAIETHQDTTALRALMTEVMLAEGRATDVRPVLRHLGNDSRTETPSTQMHDEGPSRRDTTG